MPKSSKTLRSIHHFACSGGTVVSKCIQAMHKTVVLSELHPDNLSYRFDPYDPTQLLLAQTNLGHNQKLRRDIFLQRIEQCVMLAEQQGVNLVLRDHTHSDYCLENDLQEISNKSSLIDTVSKEFNFRSIVTIRNPIESYLSLKQKKWDKSIKNFTDYCDRVEMMVKHYTELQIPIMRYEDFCDNPSEFMKVLCKHLDLKFDPTFESTYHKITMSGDSGRGRRQGLETIKKLKPKKIPNKLRSEALNSSSFLNLANEFGYSIDAKRKFPFMIFLSNSH